MIPTRSLSIPRRIGRQICVAAVGCASVLFFTAVGQCEDWNRFRGPGGSGVAIDSDALPSQWSPDANVAWKIEMPGPGASSPIIVGDRVFVTCYSGYGLNQEDPGDINNLVRHLVCVDLTSGERLWQRDIPATLPEDPYTGIGVTAHGYASHTPVSDGTNVYAFFGKGGVFAFDMEGKQLWSASAGKESDPPKWGSSSSPIVYGDTVVITAAAESQSVIAFDKTSGKEMWRQEAKGLDNMWGTPALVPVDDGRTDLVMMVGGEIWGLNPKNGKMRWYVDGLQTEQAYSSVIRDGSRVFAFGGRGGGSIAVDAGGSGDVSKSKVVWNGSQNASFASPVRHKNKLYSVSRGVVSIVDAQSGERIKQLRLRGTKQTGGRFGSLDYASPIVVGDRMFYINGSG
ncbi:MAG: PQQ-binding-like beta-propeller repeat protein, partial [Planctomycetota bacterium]